MIDKIAVLMIASYSSYYSNSEVIVAALSYDSSQKKLHFLHPKPHRTSFFLC